MPTVNQLNPRIDLTVRVYDDFYQYSQEVNANEWDLVLSFFLTRTETRLSAENLATTLFRIANETNRPVLDLFAEIEPLNQIEITTTLAYYLNGLRSPATLLGVSSPITANAWAARNVLP